MKKKQILLLTMALMLPMKSIYSSPAFTGEKLLSCEAILCLAGGWGEPACNRSINHFFSIWRWSFSATIAARLQFLQVCPTGLGGIAGGAGEMPRSDLLTMATLAGKCSGDRYLGFVQGMGSYGYDDGSDGGSGYCSWDERSGRYLYNGYDNCTNPRGSMSSRIASADRQCAPFTTLYETEPKDLTTVKACTYVNDYSDGDGNNNRSLMCTESLYRTSDVPAEKTMPNQCYWYVPRGKTCTSIEHL